MMSKEKPWQGWPEELRQAREELRRLQADGWLIEPVHVEYQHSFVVVDKEDGGEDDAKD